MPIDHAFDNAEPHPMAFKMGAMHAAEGLKQLAGLLRRQPHPTPNTTHSPC